MMLTVCETHNILINIFLGVAPVHWFGRQKFFSDPDFKRPTLYGPGVYILDEAQTIPKHIQSKLLKVMEEPHYMYRFLCTTDPDALLPALVSRCHVFKLSLLKKKVMNDYIRHIAGKIHMPLTQDEVDQITALAKGVPREALKILERQYILKEIENDE